jgi:predicted glycoside hydrolase/deacetylase ChbG (UPF0249 family)
VSSLRGSSARVLVVNGDDFGLTDGVNRGIVDAHTKGILTSASIFPNAPATDAAFALAARVPTLGVGIHLTLVDGTPVLPAPRFQRSRPTAASVRHGWSSSPRCLRGGSPWWKSSVS